ncbi:MAG: hypothetical protein KC435_10215 [Thermomicrobiales bacterium]|nr:hypothetical protein [Thermomicrobiales bacterium]
MSAAIVGAWIFIAFTVSFPGSGLAQRLLATLVAFAGGFFPPGEPSSPIPPTAVAIPSVFAIAIVFSTALTVVYVLSRRARNAIRVWRSNPRLVVVGSGATANSIVASATRQKITTVLISDDENSIAAHTAAKAVPVLILSKLDSPESSSAYKRLVRRAQNIVVATESASENLRIRQELTDLRPGAGELDDFRSLMAVVQDPRLAEVMRPARLTGAFIEEDVTCPAENVAEHICHLIDAAATGPRVVKPGAGSAIDTLVDRVVVQVIDVGVATDDVSQLPLLAETIEIWVRRQSWGRIFLRGKELDDGTFNPIVRIQVIDASDPLPTSKVFTIRIYAGSSTMSVITALEDQAARPSDFADLTILLSDEATAQATASSFRTTEGRVLPGREWLEKKAPLPELKPELDRSEVATTIAVDPLEVGLDANLIVDAITLQWARMFAQTHDFMYAGAQQDPVDSTNRSIIAWEPGADLADRVIEMQNAAIRSANETSDSKQWSDSTKRDIREARKKISDRYSSQAAVKNMLRFLNDHGYELVRCERKSTSPPVAPYFAVDTIAAIANAEHDDWRHRVWFYPAGRRALLLRIFKPQPDPIGEKIAGLSASGVRHFSMEELESAPDNVEKCIARIAESDKYCALYPDMIEPDNIKKFPQVANYNRRIVTETYPAIAAAYGYAIVPRGEKAFPDATGDDMESWGTYTRRSNRVTAEQRNYDWTWYTSYGKLMNAKAGDWWVTDEWGDQRSVAADKFAATHMPCAGEDADGNRYIRIGTVRARLAVTNEIVESREGASDARVGDWIIEDSDGERWAVPAIGFARTYLANNT